MLNCKEHNQSDFSSDHLVMSMCRVISWVIERVFAVMSMLSWQNSVSLCPAPFCIPRPNLSVIMGTSWLPPFVFKSPVMKMTPFFFFFGVNSRRWCRFSLNWSTSVSLHQRLGHRLQLLWMRMVCLGNESRSFSHF